MASVNKVLLVGNLGRDPEIRSMQNGGKVCNLSVATSERWRDRTSGEQQERTEWHRVVVFDDRIVDVAERYLKKDAKLYLEGELQTRKWQDNQGQDRYTTEIIANEMQMLDSKGSGGNYSAPAQDMGAAAPDNQMGSPQAAPAPAMAGAEFDDDIPF